MGKMETPIGNTHAAHETRHLARKMQAVRNGELSVNELEEYKSKLENERESLITRVKDCWSHLGGTRTFDFEIPVLTKEEAGKYKYLVALEPSDFLSASKLEMHYMYGTPAPTAEHLHTATMLMSACIRDLAWAIGEINAYLSQDTNK